MKRSLIIMLVATLLVGALMVSCNSDVASESADKLVKVSIAGDSKGISATGTPDDANVYYWYYKASKADNSVYRTGQTVPSVENDNVYTNGIGGWTAVADGTGLTGNDLGYFSTGDWVFSFRAYKTAVASWKSTDAEQALDSQSQDMSPTYHQYNLYVTVSDQTIRSENDRKVYISVTLEAGSATGDAVVQFPDNLNWLYTNKAGSANNATLDALTSSQGGAVMYVYYTPATGGNAKDIADTAWTVFAKSDGATIYNGNATFASFKKYDGTSTSDGDITIVSSPTGTKYALKFVVKIGDEIVGTEYVDSVTTYSYGTIAISKYGTDAVTDNETIYHVVVDSAVMNTNFGSAQAKASAAVVVTSTSSPAIEFVAAVTAVEDSTPEEKTTVSFPADSLASSALTASASSVEMEVTVYQTEAAAANADFTVSSGNTFAGLDLDVSLVVTTGTETTTQKVSTFNNQAVTVTTYIAKGLTNVTVANGAETTGDAPTFVSYDSETGKLVFRTTHFSSFAVGADQNVYDKTTNMAYKVADEALLCVPKTDELVLLDSSKANNVPDEIDVFNAGYKWTVVHAANETRNTDFAGGYGTKVEPFIIASRSQFLAIGTLYASYNYYVVDHEAFPTMDASDWPTFNTDYGARTKLDLNGALKGNGLVINNLDSWLFNFAGNNVGTTFIDGLTINAKIVCAATGTSALLRTVGTENVYISNVAIHGSITGSGNSAPYIGYGFGNYADSANAHMHVTFKNCISDASVTDSGQAGGFFGHIYCSNSDNSTSSVTLIDSKYCGKMVCGNGSNHGYISGNVGGYGNIPVIANYSNNFVYSGVPSSLIPTSGNSVTYKVDVKYTYDYAVATILGNITKNDDYSYSVAAATNAVSAKAYIQYSYDTNAAAGNGIVNFILIDENLTVADNTVTTSVKYAKYVLNQSGDVAEDTYNIINTEAVSFSNLVLYINQYDANGDSLGYSKLNINANN